MTPLIFLGFFGFAVAIVIIAAFQSKKTNEAWAAAAAKLGFDFEPGSWTKSREMSGMLDGVPVTAHVFHRGSGKNRRTYTGYRASVGQQLPAGLRLHKQGIFSGFAQFFGAQDIEIGDQEFDGGVVIKGEDPAEIAAFLTPSRKVRILSLMRQFYECMIDQEGVAVANRSVESDGAKIEACLRRVAEVSKHLLAEPGESRGFDQAIEQAREADVTAALETIRQTNEANAEPDSDALEMEAELHYLGGDYAKAAEKFGQASAARPDDSEFAVWNQASVERARETPTPAQAEPASIESEVAQVCNAIFVEPDSRYGATKLFENEYAGKTVRWPGVLKRVTEFSYDLVFKNGPGLIAQFDVHELENDPYSIRSVKASVQLPMDDELRKRLGEAVGEPLFFTGTLLKCDPFTGALFLENGAVIWG